MAYVDNTMMVNLDTRRCVAFCILLFCQSAYAGQAVSETSKTEEDARAIYVVLHPPQLQLIGTGKRQGPTSMFSPWGGLEGFVGSLAGATLDTFIALAGSRPAIMRLINSTGELGAAYDYRETISNGLIQSTTGTEFAIRHIEQYEFRAGITGMAKWIVENEAVDNVLFINMNYVLVNDLDRLRANADVYFYERKPGSNRVKRLADNRYTYLSTSRGDLFRPWDEGEKEALVSMLEEHYEYKVEQFPHNEPAYRKDRDDALRNLRRRDVILPTMAVQEGWSQATFEAEMQAATDHVMHMNRDDLLKDSYVSSDKPKLMNFKAPDSDGKLWTRKGYAVGTSGEWSVYRNRSDDVFAVPPDLIDAE